MEDLSGASLALGLPLDLPSFQVQMLFEVLLLVNCNA